MVILEIIQLSILAASCIYFSYTDIRFNRIRNKTVSILTGIAGLFDIIYYSVFARNAVKPFLIIAGVMSAAAVIMYAAHIWAAGDSKFMILVSLLIPVSSKGDEWRDYYEIMIPVYAFAAGFIFLIADTIVNMRKEAVSVNREKFAGKIKLTFLQFIINSIYVITLLKIEDFVLRKTGFQLGPFQLIFNICLLILIGHFHFFQTKAVVGFTTGASLLYSIGTGIWILSPIRLLYYGIAFVFVILQQLIGEFNYREIPTADVKTGMVLSMGSSMLLINSRVKGLPGISHEDMRNRLSEEEAEAVRRWESSRHGQKTVTIVRKIPFAVFISIGTGCYFVLRGIRG